MMTNRAKGIEAGVVLTLATMALIMVFPTNGNAQDSISAAPTVAQVASAPDASGSPAAHRGLRQKVQALVQNLTPERIKLNREFLKASALFPDFCKHWQQDLRERETNNLSNLNFSLKDGFETATYTGYGQIAGCESHQSKDGYSIGKITYEEFVYYIVGKTEEEARRAVPKAVSDTHTTEIFRWENNKWFY